MPEVITDNLDLWTTALLTRSTAGRGSNSKLEAYGIKKLRELILELAVRGKLVPQDPNDEPASVLLERIAKEKARLIKEGRIAKKESLPRLSEEEKHFDLPNGWVWARFGEVFELEYGNNLPEAKRTSTGEYPVFGSNGVVGSHDSYCIDKPCIVVGRKGSAGALNLCLNEKCWVTDVAYSVIPPSALDLKFVFKLFHTLGLDSLGKGIKPGLNRNEAYVLPIAIPSLKEQHRIVAKVDELMALCDQLEQQQTHSIEAHQTLVASLLGTLTRVESQQEFSAAWVRIASHFDTLFTTEASIEQLKQTILQLAVMGKLVSQEPNDEPASALLKRIHAEKAKLIAEGKIKKDKPLSEIAEDEKPFELPQGWVWVRLSEITSIRGGCTPSMAKSEYWGGKIPWVSPKDMHDGIIVDSELKVTDKALKESSLELVPVGSILIVGRSGILKRKLPAQITAVPCTVNQDLKAVTPIKPLSDRYMQLIFWGNEKEILVRDVKQGTTVQSLVYESLFSRPFSLPPAREQHRIVAKVDELMALCDTLKARLADAQAIQLHLADAIVEQAVC